jgi:hypothetical protein
VAYQDARRLVFVASQGLIDLLYHGGASGRVRAYCVFRARRQIGKTTRNNQVCLTVNRHLQFALKEIEKPLSRCGSENSISLEFRRHLRESSAKLRRGVDDKLNPRCAGQGRADECVGRLQQVIVLQAASR